MWTQSVNGSGNAIEENLGRVKFTSYGHKGWDNGHTVLYSNVLEINNWNEITITGEWSFTLPKTAEMRIFLYDADNMSKYSGVTYATWTSYAHEHLRLYYSPGEYNKTLREIPNSYVDFKLVITKNEMQYWEDDVLIDSADTTTLSDSNRFKLMIGGWDHSSYTQYFYYDDISVSTASKPASKSGNSLSRIAFKAISAASVESTVQLTGENVFLPVPIGLSAK